MFWLSTALFSWYLLFYVLLPIPAVRPGLDESWRALLTWAFEHGKQFGTEVIFTYGPWGFLLEPRGTVSVYPWQVLGRLVLAMAGSSGIALLGVSWIRSAMRRWIWAAAIVVLAEPSILVPVLLFLLTMPSGVESRWKRPVLMLIAFAAGLAACTKFTCFLLVAALVPLMLMRKGLATIASIVGASFLLFWLVAGQGVSNLPAFVRQSMELAGGYGSAMVYGRPWIELLLALAICGLPLLQLAGQIIPPVNLERLGCLGWLGVCELATFRQGLIRNDDVHLYMALVSVGVPIGILLIPSRDGATRVWPSYWRAVYSVLLFGALAGTLSLSRGVVVKRAKVLLESFRLYPVYARELPSLRARQRPVPVAAGSVDVFPGELSYAIQNRLPLRNRPVIQAYGAFTKSLCEKNAAFLEGQNAPQTIYFALDPIDDRYPTMEDSLAWRSLLTHYTPSSVADGYLVLQHRERPADYELRPVLDRSMRTDEVLDIPSVPGGLVWAELQVQRTFTGRLLDLLYRKEKMILRVETARRSLDFTLLDETAAGGFLLSPYVDSQASMMEIFQPESQRFTAEDVRSILVSQGKAAPLGFGRNVNVRLYALVLKTPTLDMPGGLIRDLARTLRAERPVGSVAFSPALTIQGSEVRLVVGSPSSGWIQAQPGKSLRVRYGIEGERATCSGDVSFRILLGGGPRGEKRLLWEYPRRYEAGKEWSAESTVPLPTAGGQPRLYFETESAERSCGAEGAYWSELHIEP
jgi:hypothetical protein